MLKTFCKIIKKLLILPLKIVVACNLINIGKLDEAEEIFNDK